MLVPFSRETENVPAKKYSRSVESPISNHAKSWSSTASPFVSEDDQVVVVSSAPLLTNKTPQMVYSRDLVNGAEMLQNFIQYSWQQAANHAKRQGNDTDVKHL